MACCLIGTKPLSKSRAGILLIGPIGTNFDETLIKIHTFSFTKMYSKMSSGKWRPFCFSLNVTTQSCHYMKFTTSNIFSSQQPNFTNPWMHLFHIPECSIQSRNVHISVLNEAFWDMEWVHSGICELGQLLMDGFLPSCDVYRGISGIQLDRLQIGPY